MSLYETVRPYRKEVLLLLGLALAVAASWGFIEVLDEVQEADTQRLDERLLRLLRDPGDPEQLLGPWRLDQVARDLTALGSSAVLTLTTLMAVGYLLLARRYRLALLVFAAIVAGNGLLYLTKAVVDRPRPEIVPHLDAPLTASYPSGHAGGATIVFLSLAVIIVRAIPYMRLRVYIIGAAALVAGLVGLTRVLLGVHFPTDVLGGWLFGLAWASIVWTAALFIHSRRNLAVIDGQS